MAVGFKIKEDSKIIPLIPVNTGSISASKTLSQATKGVLVISKTITDSNCRGKGVYLPPHPKDVYVPQHLRELKDGSVFISATNAKVESVIEQAFMKNPKGLRLVPPGLNLANLIQKESAVDLIQI